jgi:dolichyldiphosphatase
MVRPRSFPKKTTPCENESDSQLHLNGYGFPSSHSQYMGYFGAFLTCHVFFRHRFASTGSAVVDQLFRVVVYLGIAAWAGIVAYSR